MIESLPYDEFKIDKNINLEDIITTPDDSDVGYFVECDLKHPDNIKEKTKISTFVLKLKLDLKINLLII